MEELTRVDGWSVEIDGKRLLRIAPTAVPSEDGAASLEQMLRGIDHVEGFSLEIHTQLTTRVLVAVLRALGSSCRRLDLSCSGLGDEAASALADFVGQCTVEVMDLSENSITGVGFARICAAIAGHKGYPRIAQGLCAPCWLDLRGNAIDRPRELRRLLGKGGINTCTALRCSRLRCAARASVHLAGGAYNQHDATIWAQDELLERAGLAMRFERQSPLPQKTIPRLCAAYDDNPLVSEPYRTPTVVPSASPLPVHLGDTTHLVATGGRGDTPAAAVREEIIPPPPPQQRFPAVLPREQSPLEILRPDISVGDVLCHKDELLRVVNASSLSTQGFGFVEVSSLEENSFQWLRISDARKEPGFCSQAV